MKHCIIEMGGQDITVNAHLKLIDYFKPQDIFFITSKTYFDMFKHYKYTEVYLGLMEADYSDKIEANNLIPLDKELVEKFSPYFETAAMTIARKDLRGQFIEHYEPMTLDVTKLKIYKHLEYWNTIIERYNIDTFITHQIPHGGVYYILYALCEIKGVNVYLLHKDFTRNNHYHVKDIKNAGNEVKPIYEKLKKEFHNKEIDEIVLPNDYEEFYAKFTLPGHDLTPHFMKKRSNLDRINSVTNNFKKNGTLKHSFHILKNIIKRRKPITGSYSNDFKLKMKNRKLKKDTKEYFNYWDSLCEKQVDLSKKFIYMPLQVQPEMTTSPLAGVFQNQELAIKMLASVLPNDVYIYIKEHPKQNAAFRSLEFVNTVQNIKNVKLVTTKFNTYDLIDNSIAVASCTGTALYENAFKLKPSIMFGQWVISYMPGIYKVETKEDCDYIVKKILDNKATHTIKELKLFLLATSKMTFKGEVIKKNELTVKTNANAESVFNALREEIEKNMV